MTYSDEDVRHLLKRVEDSELEFKEVIFKDNQPDSPGRGDWANEIAAFANTGGGVILCGVSDDGKILGFSREKAKALEQLLAEVCRDTIKPRVPIRTYCREPEKDKTILLVEVPQGDALHESRGRRFHRIGSHTQEMNSDEAMRLAQRRGQARFQWFDGQPMPNTGVGTLDEALWRPLLSAESAANPEAALEKLALLTLDENNIMRATVAGVLLCSKHPEKHLPNARITAIRYCGTDRTSGQADKLEITGSLDQQIVAALNFVRRNMSEAAHKTPARIDLPQYSEQAVFEALVNAVAHRDYSIRGSRIRLSMFEDRMEIQSPGSLPNNMTIDSMSQRQSTRNEALTSALGRVEVSDISGSEERTYSGGRMYLIERRGDGVPIIQRKTQELCGQPPVYELIDGTDLRLTLPAAHQEQGPVQPVVTVRNAGTELADVDVLALFPDHTWKRVNTDARGQAHLQLRSGHLPMTIFAAAQGYAACIERDWIPAERPLALEMSPLSDGGAVIFPEATGTLPGLEGRLNPIRDSHDRTYLYASNIAVNEGRAQPVHFLLDEELHLTDANGNERWVRVVYIAGRSALVEYRARPSSAAEK